MTRAVIRDPLTCIVVVPSRRRRHAAAARIITTGLATSGFLGAVGSLAIHDADALKAMTAEPGFDPTASTVVVLQAIHRVAYVDEFGNPVPAPSATAVSTTEPAVVSPAEAAVASADAATHTLREGGLVMSTIALRRWRRGAQCLHHIIDPRTGRSSNSDVVAVAVAAGSAARAEALAKSAIVLGLGEGGDLLRRADVTAWIVTSPVSGFSSRARSTGSNPAPTGRTD